MYVIVIALDSENIYMYINSAGCHGECADNDANDQYWIGLEEGGALC